MAKHDNTCNRAEHTDGLAQDCGNCRSYVKPLIHGWTEEHLVTALFWKIITIFRYFSHRSAGLPYKQTTGGTVSLWLPHRWLSATVPPHGWIASGLVLPQLWWLSGFQIRIFLWQSNGSLRLQCWEVFRKFWGLISFNSALAPHFHGETRIPQCISSGDLLKNMGCMQLGVWTPNPHLFESLGFGQ